MNERMSSRTVELAVRTAAKIHDSVHQRWAENWLCGRDRSAATARNEAIRLGRQAQAPASSRAAAGSWTAGAAEAWAEDRRALAVRLARRGLWAIISVCMAEEAVPAWSELFGV